MRVIIETIGHSQQRYETSGDWWFAKPKVGEPAIQLEVRVSAMGDWRYEALVGIHEAIEAVLCRAAGIKEEDVTAFDVEFEKAREDGAAYLDAKGRHNGRVLGFRGREVLMESEPGDQPEAPYYRQHQIATGIERILAAELGVDWTAYEKANLDL